MIGYIQPSLHRFWLSGHSTLSGAVLVVMSCETKEVTDEGMDVQVREGVHQEIHNHNPAMIRRGRGAWHSVPRGCESRTTVLDSWAGGMLGAKCTIMAIALKELMGVSTLFKSGSSL
jgi:hypothetical protein